MVSITPKYCFQKLGSKKKDPSFELSQIPNIASKIILDEMISLMVGPTERREVNPKNYPGFGWNRSCHRDFYFDVLDLITTARASHPSGTSESQVISVDKFNEAIYEQMKQHAQSLNGGDPIIWVTGRTRMAQSLGKVKTLRIQNTTNASGDPDAVMNNQPSQAVQEYEMYKDVHLSDFEISRMMTGRKCVFFIAVMDTSNPKNFFNYFIIRVVMHQLERYIKKEKTLEEFNILSAYEVVIVPSGHTLMAFAHGKKNEQKRHMIKNCVQKTKEKLSDLRRVFQPEALVKVNPHLFTNNIDEEK